jgi:uridine kinase
MQKNITNFQSLLNELEPLPQHRPLIIGIDGRPCAGKSTLTIKLAEALNAQIIYLDEFFIPQKLWPKDAKPAFPFFYFRYNEFLEGVKNLAQGKTFRYFSHDWDNNDLSAEPTIITPDKVIIVEGVSALNPALVDLYFKKIWVASNLKNERSAVITRDGEKNIDLWQRYYIPSIDIYCLSKPSERADIIYAGRGVTSFD